MPETPAETAALPPRIDVRGHGPSLEEACEELLAGLRSAPRSIPSRHFYDDEGSLLFEEITTLPEYYQTRTERAILEHHAAAIAAATRAAQLVELGSGSAAKTRILLDAPWGTGRLRVYVPVDVSEELLRAVAAELTVEYPGLVVHGIVGDFLRDLDPLPPVPGGGPRLVIFLGGTIGNLDPETEAPTFLRGLADALSPGDAVLVGFDLVKDPSLLEAAYNDSRGVTARFNKNILRTVNALLDADFDPALFRHRAFWDSENRWIEMRLVSEAEHSVRLGVTGETLRIAAGEEIRTEISTKYDDARVRRLLAAGGLGVAARYSDPEERFALYLARLRL